MKADRKKVKCPSVALAIVTGLLFIGLDPQREGEEIAVELGMRMLNGKCIGQGNTGAMLNPNDKTEVWLLILPSGEDELELPS